MNSEQIWLMAAAGGAVALVLLVACALLWRTSRRLTVRLAELEARLTEPPASTSAAAAPVVSETAAYVITAIDQGEHETVQSVQSVTGRIDGKLFADIVARESVIKAAGLAHGLRKALSPEARNRIRFEMKREVKRSRKQRRADLKSALRQTREDAA